VGPGLTGTPKDQAVGMPSRICVTLDIYDERLGCL
jgi:hypothetical protein